MICQSTPRPISSRVTAVNKGTGEIGLDQDKSQQYGNDATVIELQSVRYSIAAGESGEPALFRAEFGNAVELVEGIEQMQILYGIDTDDDQYPNRYLSSTDVGADFEDVVSIRLMLLVRSSDDEVTEDNQSYTFNSTASTAGR